MGAVFFFRRRKSHIPAPISARPNIGPTTAPAIHALEPDSGLGVCVGATGVVEDVPDDELVDVPNDELLDVPGRELALHMLL